MKFSVDAHAIGRQLTGNEVYVRNLLNGFAALDAESEFITYLSVNERSPWFRRALPCGGYPPIRSSAWVSSYRATFAKTAPTCCTCSTPRRLLAGSGSGQRP